MVAQKAYQVNALPLSHLLLLMTKELHQLRLVATSLQFVEDLRESLLAHLSEGLRRQLTVWSRAASLRQRSSSGLAALDTAVVTNVRIRLDPAGLESRFVSIKDWRRGTGYRADARSPGQYD